MRIAPLSLSTSDFHRVVKDLQFKFYKWDAYVEGECRLIPELLVLEPEELAEAVARVRALHRILGTIEDHLRHDRFALDRLAIPAATAALIARTQHTGLQLARYDLFRTTQGELLFSEFNEDVPGGFNEAVGMPELLAGTFPEPYGRDLFADRFLRALPRTRGAVALIYATAYSEDLEHMLVLESLLHAAGRVTIRCSPDELSFRRGRTYVGRQEVGCIVRFFPGEWFGNLEEYAQWWDIVAHVPMCNPLTRVIRQSKNLFAEWLDYEFLSSAERATIRMTTPKTLRFQDVAQRPQDFSKEDWVIKRAFGRMGDSVSMGNLLSAQQWADAWHEAARMPWQYTLQRRFEVMPLNSSHGMLYPTIGIYLVNGEFAGLYSRAAPQPFLDHKACYVPTAVTHA